MKQSKSNYYLTTILLVHILVYFFKINNDEFTLWECFNRPNQAYTGQPLLKNASYFGNSISENPQFAEHYEAKNNHSQNRIIWNSIVQSYNARILHLLKQYESFFPQTPRIITVAYRQNVFHKSSEDEDQEYCLFA